MRKDYQQPAMQVIEMQQQSSLLSGSFSSEMQGYSKQSGKFTQEDEEE